MVNYQYYDSYEGWPKPPECFIVVSSPLCLRGMLVKVMLGKEDTTPISMADCHVISNDVFTVHQIWNKTLVSRMTKGKRTSRR